MTCPAKWLALCAALAAGEACGFAASRFAALWPAALCAAPLPALACRAVRGRGGFAAAAFAAGLALALAAAHARNETLAEATDRSCGSPFARAFSVGEPVRVLPPKGGVRWVSFPSAAGRLRVRVVLPVGEGGRVPAPGETWACAGWLERTASDDPSRRRALWVKGAGTYARLAAEAPSGTPAARLRRVREDLSRRMGIGLRDASAADLGRALLLGERSRLPKRDRDAFVAAGTVHVFAISGLHVMLVAGTLSFALALAGCPVRLAGPALVPLLWLYVALAGGAPSAVRAAAMASLRCLAPLFWRRDDGLVAWSATFLAVYAADPLKLYDVGCALSFAVMLGLVFWGRFARDYVPNRLAAALVTTLAAWAAGTPVAAHAFGRVTPGGVLANLALLPAAAASVKASLLGLAASFVSDRLAAYANNAAALVTDAMSSLSRVVASLPGANVEVAPWSLPVCVAWYAALALLLWLLRSVLARRRRTL